VPGALGRPAPVTSLYGARTVNGAVAVPEAPLLVTVAVPGFAFLGTLVSSDATGHASTVDEPSDVVLNVLAMRSPAAKNWPVSLNGAVA